MPFFNTDNKDGVSNDVSNVSNNVSNVSNNEFEKKVLEILHIHPTATGRGMAEEIGISDRQIWRILKKLREEGTVIRVGNSRTGHWQVIEK